MSDDLSDLSSFKGVARLFPLPNVVLFPHVMLPLHIFEPRYRQMTADALADDRLIAMVLLKSGTEAEFEERPTLHPIACLGRIVAEQRLDDGRYNLLLRGLSRARISKEVKRDQLYRSARLELLHDTGLPAPEEAKRLRSQLAELATTWFNAMGLDPEQLSKLLDSDLPLGTLGDILSFALPLAVELKQKLLEELDAEQRVQRLIQHLECTDPPKIENPLSRRFPPEFSSN